MSPGRPELESPGRGSPRPGSPGLAGRLVWAALLCAGGPGPALAQPVLAQEAAAAREAPAAELTEPPVGLVVDVYPRWVEEGLSRAEALSRRMDRADGAFRSICIGCLRGTGDGRDSFYPYRVLNAAPPAAAE